jgi:hypothetical protein
MNPNHESSESVPSIASQEQLREFLQQLSPEQLYELANFAGYLAEAEGETITQELLAIPGLRDRLKQHSSHPTEPSA